jgi:hypothetical protein
MSAKYEPTGNWAKKRLRTSKRKPKGMRRPRDESAMTRKVRPPAPFWSAWSAKDSAT